MLVTPMWRAIGNRLAGDSSLVALLGTSGSANIRLGDAPYATDPPGASFPRISFDLIDANTNDEGFAVRRFEVLYEVVVEVDARPSGGSTDGAGPRITLDKIHARILGDWCDRSTRVPVYGLDRWVPDFSGQTGDAATDYASDMMVYQGTERAHEPGVLRYRMRFSASLQKRSV